MAQNIFQGAAAMIAFDRNGYTQYVCATDCSLAIETEDQSARTVGDGVWAKNKYSGLSWNISISNIVKYDLTKFTSFDIVKNQIGFSEIDCRISFYDDAGNIKSFQGRVIVSSTSFSFTATTLVNTPISLKGTGVLKFFDGLIACPSAILTTTITGQTDPDGIIHVAYTYSGSPYQVKYRIDATGAYTYALIAAAIDIPGLSVGDHSIEIIPICTNGYEGTGQVTTFSKTGSLTCSLSITGLSKVITGNNVDYTITFNSAPGAANMKYRLDSGSGYGPYINFSGPFTNPQAFHIALPVGSYTIEFVPVCANGVSGTGMTDTFTVSGGSTISMITYNFTAIPGGSPNFKVFVDGVLTVNLSASATGSFTALTGQSILTSVQVSQTGRNMSLTITDTTLSTTLYNHSHITSSVPETDSFTFTANGDSYDLHGVVSP